MQKYQINLIFGNVFILFYLHISEKKRNFAHVIELDRHIEILLLSNDCVIVPELGGFMTHHVDARYDEKEFTYLPPMRTLGFNPQLKMNDSLLVQSYIEAYDISYPEALRRIESEVDELRQHLETQGFYELNDIGELSLNDEGKLVFEPCEAGILTPNLYGLGLFEMPLLASMVNEEKQSVGSTIKQVRNGKNVVTENGSVPENAIVVKMSWLRNAVAVAAAILALIMIVSPVKHNNSEMQQSAFLPIPSVITSQEQPSAPQSQTYQQISSSVLPYTLVLACQVSKSNAEAFVQQLADAGFTGAETMETKNMRRVVYGSYVSESDAYNALRQLKTKSRYFADAWVLKR